MPYTMKYRKEQMNTYGDWQRYLHINKDQTPAPSGVSDISFKDEIVKQSVGTIARFCRFPWLIVFSLQICLAQVVIRGFSNKESL